MFRILLALLLIAASAYGHEGAEEKIVRLTLQLEELGGEAGTLVLRADEYRRLGRWEEAFADLQRAEQQDPSVEGLLLVRGRLLIGVQWWPAARICLARHVELHGANADVLGLMADAAFGAGDVEAGIRLRAESLEVHPQPTPDAYLLCAEELLAVGESSVAAREAALAVIDVGISRLGPLVSLQLRAVDLERSVARWDAAIARIDAVAAAAPRKEAWWARRGDLLAEAGRPLEARDAWLAARAALRTLKAHRRQTSLIAELEAHLTSVLSHLRDPVPPSEDTDS